MAQLIINEIPVGDIDGINKVYTLANDIQAITDLLVDGAEYTGYTFSWTTITLNDAPTASILSDYISWNTTSGTFYWTTLGDIKTEVYLLMNQSSDSSTYDADTRVQTKINTVIQDVCKGEYRSILSDEVFKAWDLRFLRGKQAVKRYDNVTLTAELLTTDIELSCDTTNLTDSWSVVINGNVIHYTGKTATELTGVTNIQMDQDSWEYLRQVFQVETEAFKAFVLFWIASKSEFWPDMIEIPYDDNRNQQSMDRYYTILTDETSTDLWLDIRGFTGTEKFWLEYYKGLSDYTSDWDTIAIPDPYWKSVIASMVAGELLWESEQTDESTRKLQLAYSKLITFYNTYNTMVKERRKSIKFKWPNTNWVSPYGYGNIRQSQIFKY